MVQGTIINSSKNQAASLLQEIELPIVAYSR